MFAGEASVGDKREMMDDIICLSSDDSDVEIVSSYSEVLDRLNPLPPLSTVIIDVDAVTAKIPPHCIDLTDPRWAPPQLRKHKRQDVDSVIDLTEVETENLPPDDCQQENNPVNQTSKDKTRHKKQHFMGHCTPCVKLTRLPETHFRKQKTSRHSVQLTKVCFQQMDNKSKAPEQRSNLETHTPPRVHHSEPSLQGQPENREETASTRRQDEECENLPSPTSNKGSSVSGSGRDSSDEETDDFCSSIHSPPHVSSPLDEAQTEVLSVEEMDVEMTESRRSSDHSPHHSSISGLTHSDTFDPDSVSHTSPSPPRFTRPGDSQRPFEDTLSDGDVPLWQLETEDYRDYLCVDSPESVLWQEGSDEEDEGSRSGTNCKKVSKEDRNFVCPTAFRKIMSGTAQTAIDDNNEDFGTPEILCRQSLRLVYTTIEENLSEGTLQLLSDLIQPGFYPPTDITTHLLRGILLDTMCPYHICEQAFKLLMRAQRHHMVDETTMPWDWELLTSVMDNQDDTKRHRCEVVRMFLEYVVQTLEDDFRARCSSSSLHRSIAKATLSCEQQFPRVKDVINWMFSAIRKSTEFEGNKETIREKEEHIRIVSTFQRMISLALKVDNSPSSSNKLARELFHMLSSSVTLRAQRMLLLWSLQSELLRWKLLTHLLEYSCPEKIQISMSLSLLLHFLKNCILAPDPMDGTEKWQKWEELVHLLWMLLICYNKARKGSLYKSLSDRSRTGPSAHRQDDVLTKSSVCEAVEAFLCRARADLGESLPLHVEESLTYLQDHLLDFCQC